MFAAVFAGPFCSSVEFLLSLNVFVVMGDQSEPDGVGNPLEIQEILQKTGVQGVGIICWFLALMRRLQ
jgi:hypothetical protein